MFLTPFLSPWSQCRAWPTVRLVWGQRVRHSAACEAGLGAQTLSEGQWEPGRATGHSTQPGLFGGLEVGGLVSRLSAPRGGGGGRGAGQAQG